MSGEVITRAWAMPSHETFTIKPIRELLERHLTQGMVSADPFAGDSKVATKRNDLNLATTAESCVDAEVFALLLDRSSLDAVLFDPPYSPRQIAEVYSGIGRSWNGRNATFYRKVRDALDRALRPGGIAISFGWNSSGFGKTRGYERIETLIVCHGGAHNDTIVTVERKNL